MSKFYPISSITRDLKKRLVDANLFKDVRRANIGSYEHLLKIIPELTRLPAAVVCIGNGEFPYAAATRQISPAIIIIDKLNASLDDRAGGIWDLLDDTADLFMTDNPGEAIEINGVAYVPENFEPVVLGGPVSAYLLTLSADCSRLA